MIKIGLLIWDDWNVDHIKKHKVTVNEVESVCQKTFKQQLTYNKRYLIFGKTTTNRLLTIVLAKEIKDKYYVVTARDMSKKERKNFIK